MSVFEPLTMGYDWESWALGHDTLPGDEKKFEKIAERVNTELADLEAHREWHFIEVGPGILRSWEELVDRTNRYIEWVQEQFAKDDLFFYPCGTTAAERGAAGLHVHIGTVGDAEGEIRVLNALVQYIPAFLALMANSPVSRWRKGKFKAYRMSGFDTGCGGIYPIISPHLANPIWFGDAAYRRSDKPTIEIRLSDSCLSPRLLCEYVVLMAGLADWLGNHLDDQPILYSEAEYEEFLINRWQATKYGLQATFTFGGRESSATETIADIIQKAAAGMRKLGASVEDLVVIPKMLEKRQTQADFQLAYMEKYDDLISFTHAFANVLKDLSSFEKYLEMAPTLPLLLQADVDDMIIEKIGRETNPQVLIDDPMLPPVIMEKYLRKLEAAGRISIVKTPEDGVRCTRIKSTETSTTARA